MSLLFFRHIAELHTLSNQPKTQRMTATNPNIRLEAFCDGVFAIAITLLIIEIRIHSPGDIHSTADLWLALKHIAPSICAFVLSFMIILITWVNHHNSLRLVNKSSNAFIYSNGFLLLTVVFVPFPTALLGEFILSGHAGPAVVLYNAALALQALGWILTCRAALGTRLYKDEKSAVAISKNEKFGYFAFVLYTVCAIAASWYPLTVLTITTVTWIFWLAHGLRIRHE
jgi:uncharacterized membrane protein